MSDYVIAPDFRLVNLLFGLAASFGKLWAYPSQDKLRDLLQRFHGRTMSARTVNRHLGGLVRDGWIKRLRRHRRGTDGVMVMHSTLYTFTRRAIRAFASLRAGLRFLGSGDRVARGRLPCAIPGTISVPIEQNKGVAPPSGPPSPHQKEAATQAVAALRKILAVR
jgi:hypothetical protein